ncbi:MAG TPA: hypothetical protein ENI27_07580 [bacterium]|nr:hypothetical protein [bacterium]
MNVYQNEPLLLLGSVDVKPPVGAPAIEWPSGFRVPIFILHHGTDNPEDTEDILLVSNVAEAKEIPGFKDHKS